MYNPAAVEVVGHIEQGSDERSIGVPHFVGGRARRRIGYPTQHKSAFRSGRDDDNVLRHLRLHQPQHFRPIVLAPDRPSDAAASNETTPEVNAGHIGSKDKDLVQGFRLRHGRYKPRTQFERQSGSLQVGTRSHRRIDQSQKTPQYPILIEGGHCIEASQQGRSQSRFHIGVGFRAEPSFEELHEIAGNIGMGCERSCNIRLRERRVHQMPVGPVGAKDVDSVVVEIGEHKQPAEPVRLALTPQRGGQRRTHAGTALGDIETPPVEPENAEIVGKEVVGVILTGQTRRNLFDHPKAEILDERQHLGQVSLAIPAVHDDAGQRLLRIDLVVDPDTDWFVGGKERIHLGDGVGRLIEGRRYAERRRVPPRMRIDERPRSPHGLVSSPRSPQPDPPMCG